MASSREEQRKQKIPKGSSLQEEAVNLRGTGEAPSSPPARPKELTREVRQDHLMEQVVNRENMLLALHRFIGEETGASCPLLLD